MESIQNQIRLLPSPTNNKQIPPDAVDSALNGALVELHFSVVHHKVKHENRVHDSYNAIIQKISILSNPKPIRPST